MTQPITYLRDFTADERRDLAKKGYALPDGSFPIVDRETLQAAIKLYGHASNPDQAKRHIIKRARALGLVDVLPDDWNVTSHAEPVTVTIHDVEVARVGNWASALSGRVQITGEDLADMARAAADPEVDQAPVKVGHVDPRFDGEPAFGWLTNIRVVGDRILTDVADVPKQMAHLVETAFRRRSAEIAWGVKTASGRTYRAALCGLALLGVTPPAVKGLADVVARYSGPSNEAVSRGTVTVVDDDNTPAAERLAEAMSLLAGLGTPAAAAALEALAANSGDLPGAPPDHSVMTDEEVRARLGLPAEVPVSDRLREIATASDPNQPGPGTPGQPGEPAPGQPAPTPGEPTPGQPAPTPPAPGTPGQPGPGEPAPGQPAPTAGGPPTVSVDSAALAQLQGQAAQGAEAMRILNEQQREQELTAALSGGRIAPANIAQWRAAWDRDKDGTRSLLSTLPQVYSTVTSFSAVAGQPGAADADGITDDQWAAFQKSLAL